MWLKYCLREFLRKQYPGRKSCWRCPSCIPKVAACPFFARIVASRSKSPRPRFVPRLLRTSTRRPEQPARARSKNPRRSFVAPSQAIGSFGRSRTGSTKSPRAVAPLRDALPLRLVEPCASSQSPRFDLETFFIANIQRLTMQALLFYLYYYATWSNQLFWVLLFSHPHTGDWLSCLRSKTMNRSNHLGAVFVFGRHDRKECFK